MPRVTFVKRARNDIPRAGIKAGEPYYWWKFKNCPKSVSRTHPKPSQLTRSEFWQFVYGLRENNEHAPALEDIEGNIDSIKEELEGHKSELEDKLENLPENLRYAPSGETLQERIDALDEAINSLESVNVDTDVEEDDKEERANEIWQEVTDALDNISCS